MQPDLVTVVVPTYNEAENLPVVAAGVRAQGFRLLVVDDASPDGTGDLADRLADGDHLVEVLHRPAKAGLGRAYAAGFDAALESGAEVIIEMDADLSHDPTDLPRLVAAIEAGADLVVGSRYVPGGSTPDWPLSRRLISRGGNLYARILLDLDVRDATAGFRAFRRAALDKLPFRTVEASGYGFQIEMMWAADRAGLRIVEIPIVFRDRVAGTSKMDRAIVVEAMRLVTRWGVDRMVSR